MFSSSGRWSCSHPARSWRRQEPGSSAHQLPRHRTSRCSEPLVDWTYQAQASRPEASRIDRFLQPYLLLPQRDINPSVVLPRCECPSIIKTSSRARELMSSPSVSGLCLSPFVAPCTLLQTPIQSALLRSPVRVRRVARAPNTLLVDLNVRGGDIAEPLRLHVS